MLIRLGAAFVITVIPAHITWLVERHHADSMVSKAYFPGVFQAFGWGLGTLAAQPDDAPRHWMARAMGVLWAFVSIIVVAYFTATLTANLTVERFDAQISSPADLFGKKVGRRPPIECSPTRTHLTAPQPNAACRPRRIANFPASPPAAQFGPGPRGRKYAHEAQPAVRRMFR